MADIALDNDGDMLIEGDDAVLVQGDDAIRQHLDIRFKFFLGEWFLDIRIGIPYFDEILVKNPNLSRVRAIFTQVILDTPGIESIEQFSVAVESQTRILTVEFSAKKTDGELLDYTNEFIID